MLEELKQKVYEANMKLPEYDLIKFTWGNVSQIDETRKYIVIKPSGVDYNKLTPDDMVVVDLEGNVVEGKLNPSSDTDTHIELYKAFPNIWGICHTHSKWATLMAQAKQDIHALGTTHADYFYGTIPCTSDMSSEAINGNYEANTGTVIIDEFKKRGIDPMDIPAVLVASHGPFTFGKDAYNSVFNAVVLEEVAFMNWHDISINYNNPISQSLLDKHYLRKHGANAYYGQK